VPNRPVFHEAFGQHLKSLRDAKGWTQSDVERYAIQRKLPVTRQIVLQLEKGKTKHPKPVVIRALGDLYGVPYEDLAARLVSDEFGTIDLPRHAPTVRSRDKEGIAHVRSELASLRAHHSDLLRELRGVTQRMLDVLEEAEAKSAAVSAPERLAKTDRAKR
jgi:transcriptional regulator with XRE-family HTH domain